MSREVMATHDRMLGAMVMQGNVVAVDTVAGMVRIKALDWVSPWVRWHALAAGKARHWRAPSMNERGTLFSPSGEPSLGRFIPGLYSDAGPQPDNRDHVEVWRFDDGGSIVYDWEAKTYDINLPTGTVTIKVGGSIVTVTDNEVAVKSASIKLQGATEITGTLRVTGDITGLGMIIDTGGNTPNHKH
ncbi:phage baseplate assembly protein V [Pseudomonas viridiflava]|uniref:phage baseplate assembly protein V n=1 Tax=Pseudomonas viridiflava TaxID=33069 RepID=UPI000F03F15C|nr:phage baseplate assembly protein V [Pseudomonas viridiflava]